MDAVSMLEVDFKLVLLTFAEACFAPSSSPFACDCCETGEVTVAVGVTKGSLKETALVGAALDSVLSCLCVVVFVVVVVLLAGTSEAAWEAVTTPKPRSVVGTSSSLVFASPMTLSSFLCVAPTWTPPYDRQKGKEEEDDGDEEEKPSRVKRAFAGAARSAAIAVAAPAILLLSFCGSAQTHKEKKGEIDGRSVLLLLEMGEGRKTGRRDWLSVALSFEGELTNTRLHICCLVPLGTGDTEQWPKTGPAEPKS
ncbi:hypothetical protein FA10DRAFT_277419 [Acaromyces ingoldii]|uniref:Uncharacterized protein n=1 Tax=Acaromyces ingoldii TaxID=215250 RepID=A0A316Z0M8_9BASI|nr:hypothetical protein FA10DRAFT_277419 [Acaromyces ingoldii]PWN93655.1 hypothetical protein FA10DRAFT_277419 [Acaromyces ingoldii]